MVVMVEVIVEMAMVLEEVMMGPIVMLIMIMIDNGWLLVVHWQHRSV